MTRRQRRWHLLFWLALALVLSVVLAGSLAIRQTPPTPAAIDPAAAAASDAHPEPVL